MTGARRRGVVRGVALATMTLLVCACATLGVQRPQAMTVDRVLAMSRAGQPAAAIVSRMRESGTVYRLSASQLAKLHDEGVPDAVLDYMQETYLAAVRRRAELREEWNDWTGIDGYWYGGLPYGWPDGWIGDVEVPAGHRDHDRDRDRG